MTVCTVKANPPELVQHALPVAKTGSFFVSY